MDIQLRRAVMSDAEAVLNWRNDEETRKNSFSKDKISLDTHKKWFEKKLSDENCVMYILMADEKPAGCIRVDMVDRIGEISYMIAPDMRRKGLGDMMLTLIDAYVPENVKVLTGFVDSKNIPSAKCFENNEYTKLIAGNTFCFIKLLEVI
jgi:RimJ/RimL family protein N-acetyltransferase